MAKLLYPKYISHEGETYKQDLLFMGQKEKGCPDGQPFLMTQSIC